MSKTHMLRLLVVFSTLLSFFSEYCYSEFSEEELHKILELPKYEYIAKRDSILQSNIIDNVLRTSKEHDTALNILSAYFNFPDQVRQISSEIQAHRNFLTQYFKTCPHPQNVPPLRVKPRIAFLSKGFINNCINKYGSPAFYLLVEYAIKYEENLLFRWVLLSGLKHHLAMKRTGGQEESNYFDLLNYSKHKLDLLAIICGCSWPMWKRNNHKILPFINSRHAEIRFAVASELIFSDPISFNRINNSQVLSNWIQNEINEEYLELFLRLSGQKIPSWLLLKITNNRGVNVSKNAFESMDRKRSRMPIDDDDVENIKRDLANNQFDKIDQLIKFNLSEKDEYFEALLKVLISSGRNIDSESSFARKYYFEIGFAIIDLIPLFEEDKIRRLIKLLIDVCGINDASRRLMVFCVEDLPRISIFVLNELSGKVVPSDVSEALVLSFQSDSEVYKNSLKEFFKSLGPNIRKDIIKGLYSDIREVRKCTLEVFISFGKQSAEYIKHVKNAGIQNDEEIMGLIERVTELMKK